MIATNESNVIFGENPFVTIILIISLISLHYKSKQKRETQTEGSSKKNKIVLTLDSIVTGISERDLSVKPQNKN